MGVYLARPEPQEYSTYFSGYVALVPAGDILVLLRKQHEETRARLLAIPSGKWDYAYAPGKWTVKEVVGHIADAERIFCYRALRIAREDATPLAGFDEKKYVPSSLFGQRTLESLVAEFSSVRAATLSLFDGLPKEAWTRMGTSNNAGISVRALACITAGHELHHMKILREKYLS
jgi:hypothetical protein